MKYLNKWRAKAAVVGLFCLSAINANATIDRDIKHLDKVVAIVNDSVILQSELDRRLLTLRTRMLETNRPIINDSLLVKQALNKLINDSILAQEAKKAGVFINDAVLNRELGNLARQNQLSLTQFETTLVAEGFDFNVFREDFRQTLQINEYRQKMLSKRIQVSDEEIDNYLSHQNIVNQNVKYLTQHVLVEASPSITQDDINTFVTELNNGVDMAATKLFKSGKINQNPLGLRTRNELPSIFQPIIADLKKSQYSPAISNARGWHILHLIDTEGEEKITIQQQNVRHIMIRPNAVTSASDVKLQLTNIKQRIENGEDFSELAKLYSQDAQTQKKGGELGWNAAEVLPQTFVAALRGLKPGQLTEPFRSEQGWHIAEVTGTRTHDVTAEKQRIDAINAIRQRKFSEEAQNWTIEARNQAYVKMLLPEYANLIQ